MVLKAIAEFGDGCLQQREPTFRWSNAWLYVLTAIVKQYMDDIQKVNETEITNKVPL